MRRLELSARSIKSGKCSSQSEFNKLTCQELSESMNGGTKVGSMILDVCITLTFVWKSGSSLTMFSSAMFAKRRLTSRVCLTIVERNCSYGMVDFLKESFCQSPIGSVKK